MNKVLIYHNEDKLWDDYINRSLFGTFFHRLGWKRVIEKSFGYPAFYLYIRNSNKIRGCLPLFQVKNLWSGTSLISVPFGVYGGILADDHETKVHLLEEAKKLARELRSDYLELRHMESNDFDLPTKNLNVYFQREIYKDHDQNMAAIPRKQRRMIRQGIKNGLTSVVGGEEELPYFYDIYAHSLRNLGTPMFPYAYFQNLFSEFKEECRILSVFYQGKRVGSVLTFLYEKQVIPYYGGAYKNYFRYAVQDFMYWELMCYGCERGFRRFDFGKSRQGSGSYDFKRHWGFEPQPLPYQYYIPKGGEMPNVSPANPKYRFFIKAWKHLPISVTKVVGPRILKYLP